MRYNKAGGIEQKIQDISPLKPTFVYDLEYSYKTDKVHQLEQIINNNSSGQLGEMTFQYNAMGILMHIHHQHGDDNTEYNEYYTYNELQQMTGYGNDRSHLYAHYLYDHRGERVVKGLLTEEFVSVNGQSGALSLVMHPVTLYVNGYFVSRLEGEEEQVSKHYYMGSERIATNIAAFWQHEDQPVDPPAHRPGPDSAAGGYRTQLKATLRALGANDSVEIIYHHFQRHGDSHTADDDGAGLQHHAQSPHILFYYHPDYLGHVEYVTDGAGVPYQYFHYSPWGESLISQTRTPNSTGFSTPYRFNAKELDSESGLFYYGARYYHPVVSKWLSVDPMAHLRESLTPYNYCSNNPIMRTDPTGALDGDYYDADGVYLGNDGIDDNKVYQLKDNYRAKFENTNVNWGGTLEEKHYNELKSKSNDLGTVQDAFVTGDAISDKRIQSLHPAIRMLATDFIKEANANSSGTLIRIAQGYRTYAEQDALYAQGRTAPGKIVTNAKGGYSNHNFGLAFDIVGITDGKVDYNLDWNSLSKLGKSKGFEWGGDWKKLPDKPHFENMFGNSLINLRALPKDKNGLPILKP